MIVQSPSKAPGAIWNADAFTAIASLASTLVAAGDVQAKDVTSVAYFGGLPITLAAAQDLFSPSKDADPFAVIYRQFFRANTDAANATTLLTISLDFDPLGDQAAPWVKKVRATIDAFNAAGGADGLQWYLAGGGCATVDTVDKIYSLFPLNVGLTAAVVFVIVAYVFKSGARMEFLIL